MAGVYLGVVILGRCCSGRSSMIWRDDCSLQQVNERRQSIAAPPAAAAQTAVDPQAAYGMRPPCYGGNLVVTSLIDRSSIEPPTGGVLGLTVIDLVAP